MKNENIQTKFIKAKKLLKSINSDKMLWVKCDEKDFVIRITTTDSCNVLLSIKLTDLSDKVSNDYIRNLVDKSCLGISKISNAAVQYLKDNFYDYLKPEEKSFIDYLLSLDVIDISAAELDLSVYSTSGNNDKLKDPNYTSYLLVFSDNMF